jgi:LPXTG-motif cell wall-anchored protein
MKFERLKRSVLTAFGAAIAASVVVVGVGSGVALAHAAEPTATCEAGIKVRVHDYTASATNSVSLYLKSGTAAALTLNQTFHGEDITFKIDNPDLTVSYVWHISVNQGDGSQFDFEYPGTGQNGTVAACRTATPLNPTINVVKVCGKPDTFTTPSIPNITYSPTSGTIGSLATVHVTATAANGYKFPDGTSTKDFPLTGSVVETCTTPLAPNLVIITECGKGDTFTTTPVAGVTYTPPSGTLTSGQSLVVKATANTNYTFTDGTTSKDFPITGSVIETCATPVAPAVVTSEQCGVADTFTTVPTTGVVYSPISGVLDANQTITVVATAAPGYAFAPNTVTSFPLVGGPIQACSTTSTPVSPIVTTTTDCGVLDSFSTPTTPGVVYNPPNGTIGEGESVLITATPAAGYSFDGTAQVVQYQFTGNTVEACGDVSVEPPVVQTPPDVVVAPPVAPDEPITGLPETGSSSGELTALGGASLLAGVALLATTHRRRRTA